MDDFINGSTLLMLIDDNNIHNSTGEVNVPRREYISQIKLRDFENLYTLFDIIKNYEEYIPILIIIVR